MANPKGFRNCSFPLAEGSQVMVYSNQDQIILQLRQEIPTETNVLQPSFKLTVSLGHQKRWDWLLNCFRQPPANCRKRIQTQ
jgi:hypothetical protein